MGMRFLINKWSGGGMGNTAPVFNTESEDVFWEKVSSIREDNFIFYERIIEWPEMKIYSYSLAMEGANGMKQNKPFYNPVSIRVKDNTERRF